MQERCFHARALWKAGSRAGGEMERVTTTWSALSKSVGLGHFQPVYSPYFMYDGSTALLHVEVLPSGGFPPVSKRTTLDGVRNLVKTEENGDKTP